VRRQIRSMGHCWVPTGSALLGRCFLVPVPRNVPLMPAAAYLEIWGPNNTDVDPLFHRNQFGKAEGTYCTLQSCPATG